MEEDIVHTVTDTLASKVVCCNGKVLEHCARMTAVGCMWSSHLVCVLGLVILCA